MDDIQDRLGLFQYMWSLGFISDQTYTLLKLKCGSEPFMIPFIYASEACKKVLKIADKEMGNIDRYSVFTPACVTNSSQSSMLLNKKRPFVSDLSRVYDPCTKKHSKVYFNLPKVQKALHVPPQVARGVKWADRPMVAHVHIQTGLIWTNLFFPLVFIGQNVEDH